MLALLKPGGFTWSHRDSRLQVMGPQRLSHAVMQSIFRIVHPSVAFVRTSPGRARGALRIFVFSASRR